MLKEFKEFISKGNVLDLAIGIIIGGAFGKIVTSLVADVLMPLLGLFLGKINFSTLFLALDFVPYENMEAAKKAGAPLLTYGNFLQAVIDFLIICFSVFLLVKVSNRARGTSVPPAATPTTKECPQCLSLISMKAKRCPHCTSVLENL